AIDAGYRLNTMPSVTFEADPLLGGGSIAVSAQHSTAPSHATAVLDRIELPDATAERPKNAQLIVDGQWTIALTEPIVNLGRSRSNHVVLDDPYVSRHHAQIRLRFGRYTLFDAQSQAGT